MRSESIVSRTLLLNKITCSLHSMVKRGANLTFTIEIVAQITPMPSLKII